MRTFILGLVQLTVATFSRAAQMRTLIVGIMVLSLTRLSVAAVGMGVTKTGTIGAYDEYTLKLLWLDGADGTATNGPGTVPSVGTIDLKLTAGAGVVFSTPGGDSTWRHALTNGGLGGRASSPPATYINFDTVVMATRTGPSSPTSTSTAVDIQAGIFSIAYRIVPVDPDAGTAADDGFDQTLVGRVYVTAGALPAVVAPGSAPFTSGNSLATLAGQWSLVGTALGTYANGQPAILVVYVPEPWSMSLFAGAAGVLMCGRRSGGVGARRFPG